MKTHKKLSFFTRFFLVLFFLLIVLCFGIGYYVLNVADATYPETEENNIQDAKMSLPACLFGNGATLPSLYQRLAQLGETPAGVGVERSQLALQRGGLTVSFTLGQQNGNWTFLTTNAAQKTCIVAAGTQWHKIVEVKAPPVSDQKRLLQFQSSKKHDIKQVGYSAPILIMRKSLQDEGKRLVASGEQTIDLAGSTISKVMTYFFVDDSGMFTAVTSVTQTDKAGYSFELSSVDSIGNHWMFSRDYAAYTK